MNLDFRCDQGVFLGATHDVQMQQGVCFALATQWAICMQKNRNFAFTEAFYPAISRQRAYTYTWEQRLNNLGQNPTYQGFFQAAEPPSYTFLQNLAGHENLQHARQVINGNQAVLSATIQQSMAAGQSCIIGLWGVDGGSNWGHALAFGKRNIVNSRYRYFDSNFGQFSWPTNTGNIRISSDIANRIFQDYTQHGEIIHDFTIYQLS